MNIIDNLTTEERYAMMRKRHAFLSETVKGYTSLEDYARDKEEWFAILGIELSLGDKCISLWMQLDYYNYEEYFIEPTTNGNLAVSTEIWWQDDMCCNSILNIFTEECVDN